MQHITYKISIKYENVAQQQKIIMGKRFCYINLPKYMSSTVAVTDKKKYQLCES